MNADVIVIGAGITGAAVARGLSRYGLDIILVERKRLIFALVRLEQIPGHTCRIPRSTWNAEIEALCKLKRDFQIESSYRL